MATTTAAWMEVTNTKATFTAPVAFGAIVWTRRVIPELHELERLNGATCMATEIYVVPKNARTAHKLRPYITICRQIDDHPPKQKDTL